MAVCLVFTLATLVIPSAAPGMITSPPSALAPARPLSFGNATNGSSPGLAGAGPQVALGPSSFGTWNLLDQNGPRTGAQLAERTLSPTNASLLYPVWAAPLKLNGSVAGSLIVNNWTAYFGDWNGTLHAVNVSLNPPGGSPFVWNYTRTGVPMPNCVGNTYARGITSTPVLWHNTVIVGVGDGFNKAAHAWNRSYTWVVALNATATAGSHIAKQIWATNLSGKNLTGSPWSATYIWSSPIVYDGNAYVGVASGCDQPEIQGQLDELNATTGHLTHIFNVTSPGDQSGPIWSSPSIDAKNNTIWVTTGNDEPGNNNTYSRSFIALNASNISRVLGWMQVGVPNEDEDFGAGPMLFSSANGTPLVGGINKDGYLYVAERGWFTNHSGGPVQVTTPLWQQYVSSGYATSTLAFGNGILYAGGGHYTPGWERYTYTGLPAGCVSQNTSMLACQPRSGASGLYTIHASVIDSAGHSANGTLSLTVVPTSATLQVSSFGGNSVTLGSPTRISASVSGGSPPYTYSYSGLPTGCTSSNTPSISCTPTASGDYPMTVTVTDSIHSGATAAATLGILPKSGSWNLVAIGNATPASVMANSQSMIQVVVNDTYVSTQIDPGTVRALYPNNGTVKWLHVSPGLVRAGVTYADGLVIDAATWWNFTGSTLEVLNAATGARLYEYNVSGQISGEPVVADGRIYFGTAGGSSFSGPGYLYALGINDTAMPVVKNRGWSIGSLDLDTVVFQGAGAGGSPPYSCEWNFTYNLTKGYRVPGCGSQTDVFPAANATYFPWIWVNDTMEASSLFEYTINVYGLGLGQYCVVPGRQTNPVCIQTEIIGNLALNTSCTGPFLVCGLTITYNSTILGGAHPYTYDWTFGDGAHSTLANPVHVYSEAGRYDVTLTVTDAHGGRTEAGTVVDVR